MFIERGCFWTNSLIEVIDTSTISFFMELPMSERERFDVK